MAGSWAIGAVINVIGSILINLGTNVMKLGHNKRAASSNLPDKEKPSVRKFREWQIGVALFSIGNVLNFASFGFAAQSLLAALGSIQFVSNVIFSKLVLGEKWRTSRRIQPALSDAPTADVPPSPCKPSPVIEVVAAAACAGVAVAQARFVLLGAVPEPENASKRVLMATACIVGGCILLVSFGNHQSQTLTVEDMLHNYRSAVYIVYLVLLAISVVAFYLVYRFGKRKLVKVGQTNLSTYWMRLLPVSYALFSGMLGTQSVLFSKTLSTLIRTSIKGDSQVDSWFFWFIIVCLIATAFFWVSRLNKALKLFPAIIIVPTMQISWTLFSIISGGVYFKEYLTFTKLSATMFALGVLIVFAGVYLLTPAQKKELKDLQEQFMRHDSEDDLPDHQPGDMALVDVEQASSALASGGAELRQKTAQRSANHTEDKENLYSGELSHASVSALRIRTSDTGSAHHSTRPTCPAGSIHGGNGHHGHAAGSGRPPTTGGLATDRSFVEDVMDDFSISPREGFAELLGISEDSRMGAVSVFGGMPLVELGPTLNDEISLPSISEPAASGADWSTAHNPIYQPQGAPQRPTSRQAPASNAGISSALSPRSAADHEAALQQRSVPALSLASPAAVAQLEQERMQQAQQAQHHSRAGSKDGSDRSASIRGADRQAQQSPGVRLGTGPARPASLAIPTTPDTAISPVSTSYGSALTSQAAPNSAASSLSQQDAAEAGSTRRPPPLPLGGAFGAPGMDPKQTGFNVRTPSLSVEADKRGKSLQSQSITDMVADSGEWSPRGAVARKSASRSLRDASGLLSPGGLRRVLSPTFRGYDELDSPGAAEQLEEPLRPDALSSQLDDDG